MHISTKMSFFKLTTVLISWVSQQRYSRADRFGQRRIHERIYVGMVHHQTVCRRRQNTICTSPHCALCHARLPTPPIYTFPRTFRHDNSVCIDRLSAYALAIVVNRRSSLAGPCAVARVARVPASPHDICVLIRRARQTCWAERRIHQGDIWIPRRRRPR